MSFLPDRENSSEEEFTENELDSSQSIEDTFQSPFGIEEVDPLVFAPVNPNSLAPELRPEAYRIKVTQERPAVPLPARPTRRNYGEWVPGGRSNRVENPQLNSEEESKLIYRILKKTAGTIAISIPFAAVIYAVYVVLHLYK